MGALDARLGLDLRRPGGDAAGRLVGAVSQTGIGALRGGLMPYGIYSSEHASVNFELARNEETGAITVKYSSPEGLPVRFSWTSMIDVAGNMVSTPLVVERIGDAPVA